MILIGPIDGARHCDPEPDYLQVFHNLHHLQFQNYYIIFPLGSLRLGATKQFVTEGRRQNICLHSQIARYNLLLKFV